MTLLMFNAVVALSLAAGQGLDRPRYGATADLRGLTRVFIDTGTDVKARDRILRELRTSGLPISVADEASNAEIVLEFGASVERRVDGWITNTQRDKGDRRAESITTTTQQKVQRGTGTISVVRDGRLILVDSFADEKHIFFERDPATNFARAFLRTYRNANGLGKE